MLVVRCILYWFMYACCMLPTILVYVCLLYAAYYIGLCIMLVVCCILYWFLYACCIHAAYYLGLCMLVVCCGVCVRGGWVLAHCCRWVPALDCFSNVCAWSPSTSMGSGLSVSVVLYRCSRSGKHLSGLGPMSTSGLDRCPHNFMVIV